MKEKIIKLLTVFAYRQHGTDRLLELEHFKREKQERLYSVYLRHSSILDASSSLVTPSLRLARSEFFLCKSMFSLSLPGVSEGLDKYKAEKASNGQYVTSQDLLKMASTFEETVISGRFQEIHLGLKDPFVETYPQPNSCKRSKATKEATDSNQELILDDADEYIESEPVPNIWQHQKELKQGGDPNNMRRDIQVLNKKVDELSEAYSKQANVSKHLENVEVHSFVEEPYKTEQRLVRICRRCGLR